jgi:hypothetical protein
MLRTIGAGGEIEPNESPIDDHQPPTADPIPAGRDYEIEGGNNTRKKKEEARSGSEDLGRGGRGRGARC